MNSKRKFIEQMEEVWGLDPLLADELYDITSWEDLGRFIEIEGPRLPIAQLSIMVIVFADIMKSPRNEPEHVENVLDEIV